MALRIKEISAPDLLDQSQRDIMLRERNDDPLLILSKIADDDRYVGFVVLAPQGSVFWAWPTSDTLHKYGWASPEFAQFAEWSRRAKGRLKKIDGLNREGFLPHEWFSRLGMKSSRVNHVSRRLTVGRMKSGIIASADVSSFTDRLSMELDAFANYSTFAVAEDQDLMDDLEPKSTLNQIFRDATLFMRKWDVGLEDELSDLVLHLKFTIVKLEAGDSFDMAALQPREVAHSHVQIVPPFLRQELEPIRLQIIALRARLVRLLGWPSHFRSIIADLDLLNLNETLLELNIAEPYDPISELRLYIEDQLHKYPWLRDDPSATGAET